MLDLAQMWMMKNFTASGWKLMTAPTDLHKVVFQGPANTINIKKPNDLVKKPKLLQNFLVFLPNTFKIIRKSTKNIEKTTKTERGAPGGPKGPQPSLFWLFFLWFPNRNSFLRVLIMIQKKGYTESHKA